MSYINITVAVEYPIEDYISNNWVYSKEPNCLKKHVLARGGHLLLTPWSAITTVADTVIGIGAGVATIATGGRHKPTYRFALYHISSSSGIVARPYVNLLRTLNPEAKITYASMDASDGTDPEREDASIPADGDGFITDYVIEYLKDKARSCCKSDNFFMRHIASRLTYALMAISCLITRVVDGVIGVIAAALSFLTFGKVDSINNLAYRALQAPGIINDLFYCTTKMINPWAGTSG